MVLPGTLLLLAFNYLPMAGLLIAFKNMTFRQSNIVQNFIASPWVGFKNFEFFFRSPDAFVVTRNTLLYNFVFIIIGLFASVLCAILLNEIEARSGIAAKFYQGVMFLPYFLSWTVVSYLLYSFLDPNIGFVNTILVKDFGMKAISWYTTEKYWPFLFVFLYLWKNVGYSSVIYFAAIGGIDSELYEAAQLDGATRWKQILYITIPCISPQIYIMTLLALGKIFNSDFGMFWQSTMNLGNGMLFDVGSTIDTYVFNALQNVGNIGMASAANFYQSVVGLVTIVVANQVVRKINPDNSLF